jgi:hypothetical protein
VASKFNIVAMKKGFSNSINDNCLDNALSERNHLIPYPMDLGGKRMTSQGHVGAQEKKILPESFTPNDKVRSQVLTT